MPYLNRKQIEQIDLPKWPGCEVVGSNVTKEQATEILVRTNNPYYFSTNNKNFEYSAEEIFYSAIPKPEWGNWWWIDSKRLGLSPTKDGWNTMYERKKSYAKEMGVVDLEYLCNERVCSAYVYGPNGWCDWEGNIFQTDKNIGKWPDALVVYDEWKRIAKTFPYLKLKCFLTNSSYIGGDEGLSVFITYIVSNGRVRARIPTERDKQYCLTTFSFNKVSDTPAHRVISFGTESEIGVTLDKWKENCKYVASKMVNSKTTTQP